MKNKHCFPLSTFFFSFIPISNAPWLDWTKRMKVKRLQWKLYLGTQEPLSQPLLVQLPKCSVYFCKLSIKPPLSVLHVDYNRDKIVLIVQSHLAWVTYKTSYFHVIFFCLISSKMRGCPKFNSSCLHFRCIFPANDDISALLIIHIWHYCVSNPAQMSWLCGSFQLVAFSLLIMSNCSFWMLLLLLQLSIYSHTFILVICQKNKIKKLKWNGQISFFLLLLKCCRNHYCDFTGLGNCKIWYCDWPNWSVLMLCSHFCFHQPLPSLILAWVEPPRGRGNRTQNVGISYDICSMFIMANGPRWSVLDSLKIAGGKVTVAQIERETISCPS